jgi:hypothetical protein
MIDKIEQIVPCQVGVTSAAAYAIVTIKGKGWYICVNTDGTPFIMSSDNV